MTLTQLHYMTAVAEYGNFTIAADKCFVTQPTLSMQVQKLEEELGVKIFNRATKPIAITDIGEKILVQAKKITEEATRMQDIVSTEKGFVGGEFKLGIIPTVMPTLLPMFLNTFIKKNPKVDLKIEELTTQNITRMLEEGHLDAGIAATPLGMDHILELPLYHEPFVGYIPESNPLHSIEQIEIDDLSMTDLLVLEDGHCFRNHVLNLCQMNRIESNPFDLKSGSFETLINLADEGLGMTLLPFLNANSLTADKKKNLRFFPDPAPAREVSLIHYKSQLKLPIINALRSTVSSIIRGAIKFENIKIITPERS
ncbi:MAG: hydrogen peroxide-inducible genes activator [Flavobacteriaceae bacterium]|nr:hydrogen peroxide-inducible genes activator [Flavobacteriaceae bacterium]